MATETIREQPLVVIAGPTASGKSNVAIEIAVACEGEIISADSRAIYKHFNIGTAKLSPAEQAEVPHWGLDLIEPNERYSVADFKLYAQQKIAEIRARGHVPILVGGTGLYVDAIIFDYQLGKPADLSYRGKLEAMSLPELYEYCKKSNISLPENYQNKRYVIRAIERQGVNSDKHTTPVKNTIIVGITTDKKILRQRIEMRAEHLFDLGVVEEAKNLGKLYGWDSEAMKGNIYPLLHRYLNGTMTLNEVKQKNVTLDWRLAKRQLTWLRRNQYITWLPVGQVKEYVLDRLAKSQQA